MTVKLSNEQRAEISRRAADGENADELAAEFDLAPKYVTRLAADERKRRAAAGKSRAVNPPKTALDAKGRMLRRLLRASAVLESELDDLENVIAGALAEADARAIYSLEIARGTHLDKMIVIAEALVKLEGETKPAPRTKVKAEPVLE